MSLYLVPFLIIILASVFQGSFGLGMKYMPPLKWEVWWIVHVSIAMVVFPLVWTFISEPNFFEVFMAVINDSNSQSAAYYAILFGFLWGIGGILFGVSVPYIGLSLTMGIVMGLAGTLGALIPFLSYENVLDLPQFPYVIFGLIVTILGVVLTAKAGIDRDRKVGSALKSESISKGILIAILCGVLSSLLAVGHTKVNAETVVIAKEFGVNAKDASLIAWLIVFTGAFAMNLLYSLILMIKANSWNNFRVSGSAKSYMWAIIAGLCWFAALGLYGQGAALLNEVSNSNLGNIVGWPMLLGLSLIVSNYWAYKSGEWKSAKGPFKTLMIGLVVLVVAAVILGYSNTL